MAVDRRELILLLFLVPGSKAIPSEPIAGVTRLQKLLYLLEREYGIRKLSRNYFTFEPYKFGPYTSQLYDDLAFLENLGFVKSGGQPLSATLPASQGISLPPLTGLDSHSASRADMEEAGASYEYLLEGDQEVAQEEDLQERVFHLTPKGEAAANTVLTQLSVGERDTLTSKLGEAKRRFGGLTLRQLLSYVYREYPESAVQSEIIHKV